MDQYTPHMPSIETSSTRESLSIGDATCSSSRGVWRAGMDTVIMVLLFRRLRWRLIFALIGGIHCVRRGRAVTVTAMLMALGAVREEGLS